VWRELSTATVPFGGRQAFRITESYLKNGSSFMI